MTRSSMRSNEVEEDKGTVRLVARARKEISAGAPVFPMAVPIA
jgi:hypothetical protein